MTKSIDTFITKVAKVRTKIAEAKLEADKAADNLSEEDEKMRQRKINAAEGLKSAKGE